MFGDMKNASELSEKHPQNFLLKLLANFKYQRSVNFKPTNKADVL
jgi:hypothetical protein